MRRKLTKWLTTLAAGLFVLPFSTCAQRSVEGVIQSIKPCDFVNCQDPSYIDPCMFIQCDRPQRTPSFGGDSTTSSSSTSSSTSSSSGATPSGI